MKTRKLQLSVLFLSCTYATLRYLTHSCLLRLFAGDQNNDRILLKPDYFSNEVYTSSSELESYITDSRSTSCSEENPTSSMMSSNFTVHQLVQYCEPNYNFTSPANGESHMLTARSAGKKMKKRLSSKKKGVASITGEIDSTVSLPYFSLQSTTSQKPIGNFTWN